MRLVVGITGATGAIYGIRALEMLNDLGVETHLVISRWGARTIAYETDHRLEDVRALATASYVHADNGAALASGSFRVDGMLIAPCSMRTLAAISAGLCDNLITRAADVALKDRRRLVLMPRETPLHEIHLDNMLRVTRAGAIVAPPVPAFYHRPTSMADVVDQTVARVLDLFGLDAGAHRWDGKLGPTQQVVDPVTADAEPPTVRDD